MTRVIEPFPNILVASDQNAKVLQFGSFIMWHSFALFCDLFDVDIEIFETTLNMNMNMIISVCGSVWTECVFLAN